MTSPTLGRIVLYRLSSADANYIQVRRFALSQEAAHRLLPPSPTPPPAQSGHQFPAVVVRADGGLPSLHVLLDGPDTHWVFQVSEGIENGQWLWPSRPGEPTTGGAQ